MLTAMTPAPLQQSGGWSGVLGTLTSHADLDRDTAYAAMAEILEGEATPVQIAGFIVALRMKGETVDELTGLVGAMRDRAVPVELDRPDGVIDLVGTGGDRSHTINVSTLAALTVVGAGGRVCKHGNRAASSACGTADVLEALGLAFDLGPEGVARCVDAVGFGFCFAPRFHGAMRHAGPPRKELGVPTVFNFLGPLANPARVTRQVTGVADPAMAERMVRVLANNGSERALVVYGHDGLDELTTTTTSTVHELRDGEVRTYDVDPVALGIPLATLADLQGGDATVNAEISRAVLGGEPGPKADIVALNAAAGLVAAGLADTIADGLDQARAALADGRAAAALDAVVTESQAARAAGL
jgi:anthranilate phosphoribosyltransferase